MLNNIVYAQQAAGLPPLPVPAQTQQSPATQPGTPQSVQQQMQPPAPAPVSPQVTPSGTLTPEALQKLTPEQRKAVQDVMQEKGGVLTPEAIEVLKTKPEFKGLTPEDIMKGREILEKKETETQKKEPEKAIVPVEKEKAVIGEERKEEQLFYRIRKVGKYQDISTDLKPFGYDFFREAAIKVLTDRKDIPVPSQYVIGPGDEVKILLWGRVNAQHNLVVDRDGNITIPQIGPIQVAGMTFEDMSKHLIEQAGQIVGANIDITMGSLKTIPIFVLGDVKRPGAYTIGSFATITDALLIAGGPTGIGTMRNIQLKRKDKIITTYDLYDLLLKGDKSKDMMLQAGDVVFVPVTGPLVGIAGNVKRPAIYELKGRPDLYTLIELAGGIIPSAYTQQIQVERIIRNERQVVVDIDDKDLTKSKGFTLQDADLVKIFNIVDKEANVVFIYGNIKRPGKYEYKTGMRIKDILKDEKEFLPETYFDYALIKRLMPPNLETQLVPINLNRLYTENDERQNIELNPQDILYIFSKWFFMDRPYINIEGEVRKGGRFDLDKDMRVKDAILIAGGLTRDAYKKGGELLRTNKETKGVTLIKLDLEKALEGDPAHNIALQDLDRIVVHSIWGYVYKKTVSVDGEVLKPGTYPYTENMTVKDLIFSAGNVLESAYLDNADVSFQIIEDGKSARIEHVSINLGKALIGDSQHNIVLKPYSRLFVKKITDWRREQFVNIAGEVNFPGKYIIKKGETLSSLIERAGGYTDKAYLRGAVFTRARVKELQQNSIDEMVTRLEKALMAESTLRMSTAVSAEEVAGLKAQQEGTQKLIDSLKRTKATGRMTVQLAHLRLLKGSGYDIELEDGDTLHIPTINNVVHVAGAVMMQGSYIYSDGYNLSRYVEMAGGYTKYADTKNMFIVKADGSAMKVPGGGLLSWNPFKSRWEVTAFGEPIKTIEPGDTIVVPERLQATAWLRGIKDISQILMQLAVAGASIHYMFKNDDD
jgi:protein involved in polysaccharide export with SLBB domain